MRLEFIHAEKADHSITALCRVLKVSKSGYYAWVKRPECAREREDRLLRAKARASHDASRGTYGAPRVHADLKAEGFDVSRKRIAPARHSIGKHQRKPSTNCYALSNKEVLRRLLECEQYASGDYRQQLRDHGIVCSMSRKADCWDNAVAESFFATLKKELIHRHQWPTTAAARAAIAEYIEMFYNARRRHSANGMVSPVDFERNNPSPMAALAA